MFAILPFSFSFILILILYKGNIERAEKGVFNFHFYMLTLGVYHLKLLYGPNRLFKNADITTEVVPGDKLLDSTPSFSISPPGSPRSEPESLNFDVRGVGLNACHVGKVYPVDIFVTGSPSPSLCSRLSHL